MLEGDEQHLHHVQLTSRRMTRMLLGANDTVAAVLELEGTSSAAALSINNDLGRAPFLSSATGVCGEGLHLAFQIKTSQKQ